MALGGAAIVFAQIWNFDHSLHEKNSLFGFVSPFFAKKLIKITARLQNECNVLLAKNLQLSKILEFLCIQIYFQLFLDETIHIQVHFQPFSGHS